MKKYDNKRKKKFIGSLSDLPSLDDPDNDLTKRCKFNFSYFDPSQDAGQRFHDWSHKQLYELLEKIQEFTKKPLEYWLNERAGSGGLKMLAIYKGFPSRSDFVHPKYIPHQAKWGRFRLASKLRLVGFTIPTELHKTPHRTTNEYFDKNTFYVVFLDRYHRFYLSEGQ